MTPTPSPIVEVPPTQAPATGEESDSLGSTLPLAEYSEPMPYWWHRQQRALAAAELDAASRDVRAAALVERHKETP